MKRNDKIIVLFGVFILIVASIGIYIWVPQKTGATTADANDFLKITGELVDAKYMPTAITVSDASPFYPLIVTPLAVNYNAEGEQKVIPLLVEKLDEVSTAVERVKEQLNVESHNTLLIDSSITSQQYSLDIAKKYWTKSEGALLIKCDEAGYNLGIVAVPLASYLSIPVIVCDELDQEIRTVLDDLGVEKILICGNLEEFGNCIKFKDTNEINDLCVRVIKNKFEEINYITLTNPLDSWPPEIINNSKQELLSVTDTLKSMVPLPSNIINVVTGGLQGLWYNINIPDEPEYKYALLKLDLKNLEDPKMVEDFGDGLVLGGDLVWYMQSYAHPSDRDRNGNIKQDKVHFETVLYDDGGKEYSISVGGAYLVLKEAKFELTVTIEGLSDPYYPTMNQFSSIAPYLTAYHKGLVFADPNFAFAANDNVKLNGKTLPGNSQVFLNPILIPNENQHVYENIYKPLIKLLAKIRDKNIDENFDNLEELKNDCYLNPFYIALLGDTVMLPQYFYRSPHSDPYSLPCPGTYGTNVPSDFIYGNIDPQMYSLAPYPEDYLENDLYSDFPEVENIVGRITGWDVQDASALIARTIFYDKLLETEYSEWKDNAAVLVGAGCEMQKLPILTFLRQKLLGIDEPIKFPSGEKYFLTERILSNFEKAGFNGQSANRGAAQRVGFTNEQLNTLKTNGLLNKLLFPKTLIKYAQGFQNADSLKNLELLKEALFGDTSTLVIGGELEKNSNLILSDSHAIWFEKISGDILLDGLGGPIILYQILARYFPFMTFSSLLSHKGTYSVRDVSAVEMGPSVMLVEGCGSGKIDGVNPQCFLANAYLHAGVNAYISPTTFSAFYGALEPRPNFNGGVGLGIAGYIKAALNAKNGIYPEVYFNQWQFEQMILEMAAKNVDIGTALRDAKNGFLPAQFDIGFRWTPVLSTVSNLPQDIQDSIDKGIKRASETQGNTVPVEKYTTIYQLNLLGDPAFNPYEPCNQG